VDNPDRHCLTLPNEICRLVATEHFTSWTPRFEAHYQWTEGLMTYASVSKGYEAGGFAISSLQPAFLPATVWSEEIGAKWRSNDGRWSIDTAAFHYTYTNMQVSEAIQNITTIVNAAGAQAYGIELETVFHPIDHLTITDAAAFLDAHYTDFTEENPNEPFQGPNGLINNAGHQLPFMSKYTNNVRVSYDIPVRENFLTLAAEWNWRSKQYFSEIDDSLEEQPAYSNFNASIRFTDVARKWYVELYGRNLTNALVTTLTNIGGCGCLNSQYAPPRTYGVTFNIAY
jgi:iron complex outermembrane receptor protein